MTIRQDKNTEDRIAFSKEMEDIKQRFPRQFKSVKQGVKRKIVSIDKTPSSPYAEYLKRVKIQNPTTLNFVLEKDQSEAFKGVICALYGKDSGAMSILFRTFIEAYIEAKDGDLIIPDRMKLGK